MPAGQPKAFVVQQNVLNGDKKCINNMFGMDMCDNICKMHEYTLEYTLIIVPRLVTFTSEHWTSKTEQSDPGWCIGVIQGCGSSSPFEKNLDLQNLHCR